MACCKGNLAILVKGDKLEVEDIYRISDLSLLIWKLLDILSTAPTIRLVSRLVLSPSCPSFAPDLSKSCTRPILVLSSSKSWNYSDLFQHSNMSSDHSGIPNKLLEEFSQVEYVNQFLTGIQESPNLFFNAIKELASQREELDNTTSKLQSAKSELSDRNTHLLKSTSDLKLAQQRICKLEIMYQAHLPVPKSHLKISWKNSLKLRVIGIQLHLYFSTRMIQFFLIGISQNLQFWKRKSKLS